MERYCMQNHYTCRSNRMSENRSMQNRPFSGDCFDDTAIYKHADHLPLTMAYCSDAEILWNIFSSEESVLWNCFSGAL